MKETSIGRISNSQTLHDVFDLLRKAIALNTHVGTLALYSSTEKPYTEESGYAVINVLPFPLNKNQSQYTISCYVLDDREFTPNQLLAIMYTDLIFIQNLQADRYHPQTVTADNMHSQMSGVVVSENPIKIVEKNSYIELTYNGKTYNLDKA